MCVSVFLEEPAYHQGAVAYWLDEVLSTAPVLPAVVSVVGFVASFIKFDDFL